MEPLGGEKKKSLKGFFLLRKGPAERNGGGRANCRDRLKQGDMAGEREITIGRR